MRMRTFARIINAVLIITKQHRLENEFGETAAERGARNVERSTNSRT